MITTNLEKFCKAFNWQGGTIYQVSNELRRVGLSYELTKTENLINMNDNAVRLLICLYKNKLKF